MEDKVKKFGLKFGRPSWKALVVIVLVLASLGAAGYFWNEAREAKEKTPEATQARNLQETERVVGELSEILLIEGDAEPTVARVEDPEVLKSSNPDFYKNTQVGDYLVLYPQRAIVYRSSDKQIVNIAPIINTDQLQQNQQQAPAAEEETGSEQ